MAAGNTLVHKAVSDAALTEAREAFRDMVEGRIYGQIVSTR